MKKQKAAVQTGYQRVATTLLEPNPWNPNKMPGALFTKLVKNIEETLKTGKKLPPVVVRPHPTDKGRFQIIDGFHRYKVHKQLKLTDIDIFVMDVDDEAAKLLTMNLNYLRGDKDPEKYTTLITELMEKGATLDDLSALLPEDEADISDLITTYGDGEAIRKLIDAQDERTKKEANETLKDDALFIEMRFNVSVSQGKVIQREIDRIAKALHGNNLEGRALEFMAVQSSQTELPPDLAEPEKPKDMKALRQKAKDKLARLKKEEAA